MVRSGTGRSIARQTKEILSLVKQRLLFVVHLGQSLKSLYSTEKSDLDDKNVVGLLSVCYPEKASDKVETLPEH